MTCGGIGGEEKKIVIPLRILSLHFAITYLFVAPVFLLVLMGTRLNCQNLVLDITMFSQTQTPLFLLNSTACQAWENEDHLKVGHELRQY